jgi:hypothetical protein
MFFCEVAVISHMRGLGLNAPGPRWRHLALGRAGPAEVRCAFGRLVSQAVRRRSTAIPDGYTAVELERHVFGRVMKIISKTADGCRPEPRWRAGPYVWTGVRGRLNGVEDRDKNHPDYDSRVMPHPETGAWERAGLVLHGDNWHDQREEVEFRMTDRRSIAAVAFGHADPAGTVKPAARRNLPPVQKAIYELSSLGADRPFRDHARACLELVNAVKDERLLNTLAKANGEMP